MDAGNCLPDVLRSLVEVIKKPWYVRLSKFCEKPNRYGIICGYFNRVVKYLERLKAVVSERIHVVEHVTTYGISGIYIDLYRRIFE